jgi:CheY-like chemotaxis protein
LSILESLDEALDLLVTDLMMPGIKGWDVGRAVRHRYPDCALIYMSGYNDARVRHELAEDSLFLSKPFTPPKLTDAVSTAFRSRRARKQ